MGAIDPVQMTQQAPHQEVLYISGWACSAVLTTTNEVSPDFGDYPYNTVPNQVQRMAKAQSMHDRKQWDLRRKLTPEQRASTPYVDFLRPIIADGDTGHGVKLGISINHEHYFPYRLIDRQIFYGSVEFQCEWRIGLHEPDSPVPLTD